MQIKPILDLINAILESPNKILIISWLFLGSIVAYLFNNNTSLQLQLDTISATHQLSLNKSTSDCEDQIRVNRLNFQSQLDVFTNRANRDRDSTNLYFYNELRKANQKISEKIITIQ